MATAAALRAALADDTASVTVPSINHVAQNGTTVPTSTMKNAAPRKRQTSNKPAIPQNVPVATYVENGVVTTRAIVADGFVLSFKSGDVPAHLLAASKLRDTSNVWFEVAQWLALQPAGYLTIKRADGVDAKTARSPMSKIDGAIARMRKTGSKGWQRLDAKTGTDKGTWYFIRLA